MVELIKTLRQGRAVLLVEHDMDAVFAVADRLTVMADGKVPRPLYPCASPAGVSVWLFVSAAARLHTLSQSDSVSAWMCSRIYKS